MVQVGMVPRKADQCVGGPPSGFGCLFMPDLTVKSIRAFASSSRDVFTYINAFE